MTHAAPQRSKLSFRAIFNVWLAWMLSCAFLLALPMLLPFLSVSPLIGVAACAVILAPAIWYTLYTQKQGAFTVGNWLFLASAVCWLPLLVTLYDVTLVPVWIDSLKNAGFKELPWLSQVFMDTSVAPLPLRILLTSVASLVAILLTVVGTKEASN